MVAQARAQLELARTATASAQSAATPPTSPGAGRCAAAPECKHRALPTHRPGGDHCRSRRRAVPTWDSRAGRLVADAALLCLGRFHGPGRVNRGGCGPRGDGGGWDPSGSRPLSLVAAVALPVVPHDRVPRRRRHHGYRTLNDEEMADVQLVLPRRGPAGAWRKEARILAIPGPTAIAHHLIRSWANGRGGIAQTGIPCFRDSSPRSQLE